MSAATYCLMGGNKLQASLIIVYTQVRPQDVTSQNMCSAYQMKVPSEGNKPFRTKLLEPCDCCHINRSGPKEWISKSCYMWSLSREPVRGPIQTMPALTSQSFRKDMSNMLRFGHDFGEGYFP